MTGSKTAEYIEADLFPLLVRKCQNANNIGGDEAEEGRNKQE